MAQRKGLFLDDIRNPDQSFSEHGNPEYIYMLWDIVRSYDEFCSFIEDHYNRLGDIPFTISFDHEHYRYLKHPIPYQNLKVKTGYHCALWLKEFCKSHNLKLPEIMIHTLNPAGRENIAGVFSIKAF